MDNNLFFDENKKTHDKNSDAPVSCDRRRFLGKFDTLSERLQKIADCISTETLADIGTDHGYIPIYCVKNGRCTRAIASDINKDPLKAACDNITENGLSEKIETRLSNGLEGLLPNEADTIVIAGMGGFLIRDILINGADKIGDNTVLILQPMVAASELREYLCKKT